MVNAPELDRLVYRLNEAGLSTKRGMKLDGSKAAFEPGWEKNPHDLANLPAYDKWGVAGREGLVLIDIDILEMEPIIRSIIPATFETKSPRRGLPHFYLKVIGAQVPNRDIFLTSNDKSGAGEIRALNYYLVAPGTEIAYIDLKTGEQKTGRYTISKDIPIASMSSEAFLEAFKPYLKGAGAPEQRITPEDMKDGVDAGTRHPKGIRYALHLVGTLGLTDSEAFEHLQRWDAKNRPPMGDRDLIRMVKKARQYVNEKPQTAPTPPPTPKTAMEAAGFTIGFNKRGGGLSLFKNGSPIDEIPANEASRKTLARDHKLEYLDLKQAIIDAKNRDTPKPRTENEEELRTIESPGGINYEQIQGGKYARYNSETDTIELVDSVTLENEVHIPLRKPVWELASEAVKPESFNSLFSDVSLFVHSHVDYGSEAAPYTVHAAFICATYLLELWKSVPYRRLDGTINVGKTRSMETSHALAFRHMMSGNISEAAIFRICDQYHPSLGLDEVGRYVKDKNSTVLDLLNSGYRRGMPAIRMEKVGDSMQVGIFDTFAFKEFAGTDELTPAINSRSIIYQMKGKTRDLNPLIDEATAKEIRNRLLYFRFQVLAKLYKDGGNGGNGVNGGLQRCMTALQRRGFDSRQIELYTPLLLIAPEGKETKDIIEFMLAEEEQKGLEEKEGLESKVVSAVNAAHIIAETETEDQKKTNTKVTVKLITTNDIYEAINANHSYEIAGINQVGRLLKALGFTKQKTAEGLAAIRPNYPLIKNLMTRYCNEAVKHDGYDGSDLPKLASMESAPIPLETSVLSISSVSSVKDNREEGGSRASDPTPEVDRADLEEIDEEAKAGFDAIFGGDELDKGDSDIVIEALKKTPELSREGLRIRAGELPTNRLDRALTRLSESKIILRDSITGKWRLTS